MEERILIRYAFVFFIALTASMAAFLLVDDIFLGLQGLPLFYGG